MNARGVRTGVVVVFRGLSGARGVDRAGVSGGRIGDISITAQASDATQQFLAVAKLRHAKRLHVVLSELQELRTRDGVLSEGLAQLSELNALEPSRNL